jgi:hypothetical protein
LPACVSCLGACSYKRNVTFRAKSHLARASITRITEDPAAA